MTEELGQDVGLDRVTIAEAARRLGVKEPAVRKRIQRGTLKADKGPDGRVYVYLEIIDNAGYPGSETGYPSSSTIGKPTGLDKGRDELTEEMRGRMDELREQVRFLRGELERKDAILMSLTQRIPELEPVRESTSDERESPVTASDEEGKGQVPPEPETAEPQPWWRWIFK